jgi:hypothetical protein
MTWRRAKHVDSRREWPSLDQEITPCVELALRALWLLYNRGDQDRDVYGDLQSIDYSTDKFCLMYWHRHGHVKIYLNAEPNRLRMLAMQFDLIEAREWNAAAIKEALELMRKVMVLDELASA